MYRGKRKDVDVVFILDGTMSGLYECLVPHVVNSAETFLGLPGHNLTSTRFAVVVFRDPVATNGEDKHELLDFTTSSEEVEEWLMKIRPGGGGDNEEDWVGAIQLALDLKWNEGSKRVIFIISDANAHGPRFSGLSSDPHKDEEDKLVRLIERIAENAIHIQAINIKRTESDDGCGTTLREMESIYKAADGRSMTVEAFTCDRPQEDPHSKGSAEFFGPEMSEEQFAVWLAENANKLEDVSVSVGEWDQKMWDEVGKSIIDSLTRQFQAPRDEDATD